MSMFLALLGILFLIFLSSLGVEYYCTKLLMRIFRNNELAARVYAVIFLPGTIVHEFAHIIMAQVLGVRASGMELMPRIEGNKLIMGEVGIEHTDIFRRTMIGAAPFLLGFPFVVLIIYTALMTGVNWWQGLIVGYFVFQIANSSFSSGKDMEGTVIVLVSLVSVGVFLQLMGVPIWENVVSLVENTNNQQRIMELASFLGIALGINVFVLVFGKLVTD
jgi:hypothetical protein